MTGPDVRLQQMTVLGGGRKRRLRVVAVVAAVGVLLFMAVMTTVTLTIGIWPGEMKLTAPLLCQDSMPDAFVVSDTYSSRPGETSTNYTMYCMSERGDVEDVGWFRPLVILTLAHGALILALLLGAAVLVKLLNGLNRRSAGPPGGPVGPVSPIS
jgi:hypothetical protein